MRWYLIDRILECTPGKQIVGLKSFTRSEMFFMDHFHGFPIVPGVLQIEMMATTGGKAIKLADNSILPILGSVKSAKFIHNIRPGDQCKIFVEIEKLAKSYALANGRVEVDDKTVSKATIMYGILPAETADTNWKDPVMSEWCAANNIVRD
ncbi:MAG: 3-hydroxyacyl-ACP dehydratase FabZ family protein [Bdellovibrionota bacterium]